MHAHVLLLMAVAKSYVQLVKCVIIDIYGVMDHNDNCVYNLQELYILDS